MYTISLKKDIEKFILRSFGGPEANRSIAIRPIKTDVTIRFNTVEDTEETTISAKRGIITCVNNVDEVWVTASQDGGNIKVVIIS